MENVVKTQMSVGADVVSKYNPLSKMDCIEAACKLHCNGNELIQVIPENYVCDSFLDEGNEDVIKVLKDTYFKDKSIRLFDMLQNPNDYMSKMLDAAFDVVAFDPSTSDGFHLWQALFQPEVELTDSDAVGDDSRVKTYAYSIIDNLLFIGQIVHAVKVLYGLEDVKPSYDKMLMSHSMDSVDDILGELMGHVDQDKELGETEATDYDVIVDDSNSDVQPIENEV